ncbi:hypothetical protein CYMTET_9282 [Cymbomonas tetramitiformis]|uniref:Uncharacterized protein n=1 Tax=Cymbomonas tetramitiformis TaxID=36881 RepID=A0AAE0GS25_9CHLO|nr:hypothetical protein CYMTET_9282 [Cymbomonas tetramitiformis]
MVKVLLLASAGIAGVFAIISALKKKGPKVFGRICLEVQRPWSRKLLNGQKTIECRGYPLPASLFGKELQVMETPGGTILSRLEDHIEEGSDGLYLTGTVVFSGCKEYKTVKAWAADAELHCVPDDSPFAWHGEKGKLCFGWIVQSAELYDLPESVPQLNRVLRSLFKIVE